MSSSKAYFEKLKDPRWQKKRLEAMDAAGFCCQVCYDSKSTLNVHHKQYFKNRSPWEYEITQLAVLCETCHENQHSDEDKYRLVGSHLSLDGPGSRDSCASLVAGFGRVQPPTNDADMGVFMLGIVAHMTEPVTWRFPEEFSKIVSDLVEGGPVSNALRAIADLVDKRRQS